jgi:hypothetical protein
MKAQWWIIPLFALGMLLGITTVRVIAQTETCPAFVTQALQELDNACGGMARNSACYGYSLVRATFDSEVPADYFADPGDRADLGIVRRIATTPLDDVSQAWGIAVLRVQANVPNTAPGQAVNFILMGDTQVVNAVAPTDVLRPVDPVALQLRQATALRSGPGETYNVLSQVDAITALEADGISPDGAWLRVLYNTANMWVHMNAVTADAGALSTLPTITERTATPMQAFYFSTGLGQSRCAEAPNLLLVQGPNSVRVNLTVNGVDITIGSTIAFQAQEGSVRDLLARSIVPADISAQLNQIDPDEMCNLNQISVLSGEVELNQGRTILPAGYTARAVSCDLFGDSSRVYTTDWTDTAPLTALDRLRLGVVETVPGDLLNYVIDLPEDDQIAPQPPEATNPGVNPIPGDFGCEQTGNACNAPVVPGQDENPPGDFSCTQPGNACNAPGQSSTDSVGTNPPGQSEASPPGQSEASPPGQSEANPPGQSEANPPGQSEASPPGQSGNNPTPTSIP